MDSATDITSSGPPAFQIQHVSPFSLGLDITEITTMEDGKLHTASYMRKSEAFQKHFESFNKIADTIKIGRDPTN